MDPEGVFVCWFSDPLTLQAIVYPVQDTFAWGRDIKVIINGVQDVTTRITRQGMYLDYGFMVFFHLLKPIGDINNVSFHCADEAKK